MKNKSHKPNVVVFFTDQQRWDTTGVHGNPLGLTPNFDLMAAQGTHLFHSFTCQPVCAPARSSMQTGLYPTETGVFRNGIPLSPNLKTLAHYFRESGYKTGYIGKWHLAGPDGRAPVPEALRGGYEYWLASNGLEHTSEPYNTVVYNNENRPVSLPGYRVDALTDAAIRYIEHNRNNPFYLFLSFLEPHHQNRTDDFPAPAGYAERYTERWIPPDLAALVGSTHKDIAGYYGMVKRLDEALGRLTDALRSRGLLENTILLFSSEHACHFKTRNSEYKRSCHESSIRVPTMIQGPGFQGGGQIRELISIVDLPPTLLDAAGIPVPEEMQGRSIMPLVKGQKADWPEEIFVQISESEVGRAVRTHRWKYCVVALNKNPLVDPGSDYYLEESLYDLHADPYELMNLIGFESHQEVAKVMRERLIRRMVEAGENPPRIDPATPRESGQLSIFPNEVYQ